MNQEEFIVYFGELKTGGFLMSKIEDKLKALSGDIDEDLAEIDKSIKELKSRKSQLLKLKRIVNPVKRARKTKALPS